MSRKARQAEAWEHFGAADPDWAVLTNPSDPSLRGGGWTNRLDEFYASGVSEVHKHLSRIPDDAPRRLALDWGCGTGRLSIALAGIYREVVSVDIAPSMLAMTRERAAERGVTNIETVLVDDLTPRPADLVFSLHVLQHLPSRRAILETVDAMCANVGDGGYLFVHIPIAVHTLRERLQPRYRLWLTLTTLGVSDATARRLGGQGMSMRWLPRKQVEERIAGAGLEVLSVQEARTRRATGGHYFARRPPKA